jgi:hypothetical protein
MKTLDLAQYVRDILSNKNNPGMLDEINIELC